MGSGLMDMRFVADLINFFGYKTMVVLKDLIVLSAGMCTGMLIMLFLCSKFLYRIESVDDLGKATAVMLCDDNEKRYFTSIKSFYQAVEFILQVTLLPFFGKKAYTLQDEKRTRIIVRSVGLLCIVLVTLALFLISHPLIH